MGIISTVKGYIDSDKLGFCHSHEHLFIRDGQSAKINPSLIIDDYDKTVSELNLYKTIGGEAIVDAQPIGCGRISEWLLQASKDTGINIISSTGFHKLIFYPERHWINTVNEETLADIFIKEIRVGMYIDADFGVPDKQMDSKAGLIKTAADVNGISEDYRKFFNAAAYAARSTGVPILNHTETGKAALNQAKFFIDKGIKPSSIIICHMDRTMKNECYIFEAIKMGVYLEFDTIGRFKYHSDEDEIKLILKLIEHGYEDKLLLGLDTTRTRLKSYGGAIGLDYIKEVFIPMLKRYGVTQETINKFMIDNPSRAFTIKK